MLLSWRDDPEKSGEQNGLPRKEVYSIGRRRRQRGEEEVKAAGVHLLY